MTALLNTPLQIGPHRLQSRLFLAPMAGITDAIFRGLCAQFGAALTFSEMITSDIHLWKSDKTRSRLVWSEHEPIKAIQLAGSEPAALLEAAQLAVAAGATWIDINMGCPMKKVCKRWAGSALMAQPKQVEAILTTLTRHLSVPVSLKTRLGTDDEHQNIIEIAQIAAQAGIAMLSIHARTRAQRFSGHANYQKISEVKAQVDIPIIANGDIESFQRAQWILENTGADGVMIGRASFGQPWIFQQLAGQLEPVARLQAIDIIRQHMKGIHQLYGEYRGVRIARKHCKWYAERGWIKNTQLRPLLTAETADGQLAVL